MTAPRKDGKDAHYWSYAIWQLLSAGLNLTDADGNQFTVDALTGALISISFPHHQVHRGRHFMYTDAVTLNAAATQIYLITAPDVATYAHMTFDLDGTAVTRWDFYEASTHDGTTLQTPGNNNRNSANVPLVTIHKGASGGADGNLLFYYNGGSSTNQSRTSTMSGNNEEIILKRNTKYLLRVTSGTAGNLTNIKLEWYEEAA